MSIKINKILDVKAYLNGELIPELSYEFPKCELFSICNCKTAMCRVALPDESCYYYRYFKKIIAEDKNAV